jgi:hypothetical protein
VQERAANELEQFFTRVRLLDSRHACKVMDTILRVCGYLCPIFIRNDAAVGIVWECERFWNQVCREIIYS